MSQNHFSRRELLQILGVTIGSTAFAPVFGNSLSAQKKPRIVIIGAGMAGVATAWLLDDYFQVTLIEKRNKLGGHADTHKIELQNQFHFVDVGAQFVAPETHPTYFKLLESIGFFKGEGNKNDKMFYKNMDMTFFSANEKYPHFVAPQIPQKMWPIFKKWNWPSLGTFQKLHSAGLKLEKIPGDIDMTAGEWIDKLHINEEHKKTIALSIVSAMNGCTYEEARSYSLKEGMAFFSRNLKPNALKPIRYFNCKEGLGSVVQTLASQCQSLKIFKDTSISSIDRVGESYFIKTDFDVIEADHIVFACPPHASKNLLPSENSELKSTLEKFTFFKSHIALHTDPIYMPKNKKYWSIYNGQVTDKSCDPCMWYSKILDSKHNLFKSWCTYRDQDPKKIVLERHFLHPLINREFVHAQNKLRTFQGQNNIWFAGSYTQDVDSQETALRSAIDVARAIIPAKNKLMSRLMYL